MKAKFYIMTILIFFVFNVQAQIQYIPASIHRLSIGLGGGITTLYGDLKPKVIKPALRGNFDYNFTPHLSAGVEVQYGNFAGGNENPQGSTYGLYSNSKYYSGNFNARLAIGQILPVPKTKISEILGGIYLGTGIGYLKGEATTLVKSYSYSNKELSGKFEEEAELIFIPVNFGVNIDLPIYRMGINLNYQYNITTGEALDGYDVNILSNNDNDAFSFLSIAVRYYFGGTH